MTCDEAGLLLHAYLDGELSARQTGEVEMHLNACADCAARLASLESVRNAVRSGAPRFAAPAALRARLMQASATGFVVEHRHRWAMAASVLFSFAIGIGFMYAFDHLPARAQRESFLASLVSSHLRALSASSAVDVLSSDRHTVKPWFAGKVDQSPPVVDLADEGFPLVGGRIDYVDEQRVPVVVYRRAQHVIDVYWLAAAPPERLGREVDRRGYHTIVGSRDGEWAWIVSDLDPAELAHFAELLHSTTSISR